MERLQLRRRPVESVAIVDERPGVVQVVVLQVPVRILPQQDRRDPRQHDRQRQAGPAAHGGRDRQTTGRGVRRHAGRNANTRRAHRRVAGTGSSVEQWANVARSIVEREQGTRSRTWHAVRPVTAGGTPYEERSTAPRPRARRAAGTLAFALAAVASASVTALDLPTLDKISVMMSMDQVRYVAGAPDEMARVAPDLTLATWRMTGAPGMVGRGRHFRRPRRADRAGVRVRRRNRRAGAREPPGLRLQGR